MRVFISYAHTDIDTELAQFIAQRLGAVGVDVWLDERSMHGGQRVQKTIEEAAAGCGHAVFLVSRSWLASDWTNWELGLFDGRTPPATLVPVWRRDREDLKLPPLLWQLAGFEWPEAEPDRDGRFWQLHCALTGQAPGPSESWTSQGQALGAQASGRAPAPRRVEPRRPAALVLRPSLRCDRAPQWKTVDDLATSGANELMLVPGATGQAHEHFSERIQRLFRPDPPREIRWVDWGGRRDESGRPRRRRPVGQAQYRDALAEALEVEAPDLEARLGALLAHQNLVLLHDCIHSRFLDDGLVDYYARWLPEWLSASGAEMNLKCVQPIEWPRESPVARLLRWVGRGATGDGNSRSDADQLLARVLEHAGPLLRAVRLRDLHDVSEPELDEFCQVMALQPRQVRWLLERIGQRRARTASDVFDAIDDFIPEVPDERSMS